MISLEPVTHPEYFRRDGGRGLQISLMIICLCGREIRGTRGVFICEIHNRLRLQGSWNLFRQKSVRGSLEGATALSPEPENAIGWNRYHSSQEKRPSTFDSVFHFRVDVRTYMSPLQRVIFFPIGDVLAEYVIISRRIAIIQSSRKSGRL